MLLFFLFVSRAKVARFLPVGKCNLREELCNFNYRISNKWHVTLPYMSFIG